MASLDYKYVELIEIKQSDGEKIDEDSWKQWYVGKQGLCEVRTSENLHPGKSSIKLWVDNGKEYQWLQTTFGELIEGNKSLYLQTRKSVYRFRDISEDKISDDRVVFPALTRALKALGAAGYSVGEVKDNALCILWDNDGYEVFYESQGGKLGRKTYVKLLPAVANFFARMSRTQGFDQTTMYLCLDEALKYGAERKMHFNTES